MKARQSKRKQTSNCSVINRDVNIRKSKRKIGHTQVEFRALSQDLFLEVKRFMTLNWHRPALYRKHSSFIPNSQVTWFTPAYPSCSRGQDNFMGGGGDTWALLTDSFNLQRDLLGENWTFGCPKAVRSFPSSQLV